MLAAGSTQTLVLSLNPSGRKLRAKAHRLALTVMLPGGVTRNLTLTAHKATSKRRG